jgi:serine/threonine-protein kinase
VAAAEPAPESRLLRGSPVTLTVSTGRPVVPAIAEGTTVEAAQQTLREAQLTPATSASAAEFSSTVPQGAVLRTDPPAGTALPIGGSVTLVLSKGVEPPAEVDVPLVIGDRLDEARERLERRGLGVDVERSFPFGRENPRVVNQDPSPGTTVEEGSTVTLTVF